MPKVSVIIPVYNAEKYLHACLDSVVNQTLTDIQIICVDDGSSDRSPQILDEYAAKDNRFKIIHQQNTGIAGARNAAYPWIKGEYTLFADNDDTIEPDLCEKTVAVADAEQADMTYFFVDRGRHWCNIRRRGSQIEKVFGIHTLTENDYSILLNYRWIWSKLWRSCFLLDNDIRCPAGQYCEDTFMQWKALIHNPQSVLLPKVMYHFRINPLSASSEPSKKYEMGLPATYELIRKMLRETGNYRDQWKRLFLNQKLEDIRTVYTILPKYRRKEYLRMVKEQFGHDEQEYLSQNKKLKRRVKVFYSALQGSRLAAAEHSVLVALRKADTVLRMIRNKFRMIFNKGNFQKTPAENEL
ncbi:MAG: glycosyltransferase family 2 protein [Planctomycetaceae bacterium]|jgi:glycosyltransferase involved in cell wall biosynthesis|nr:glycosyltransferase family 2 protein [Planctomycetaceae bacterium]